MGKLVKEFVADLRLICQVKGDQFVVMLSHKVKVTCEVVQAPGQTRRRAHNSISCQTQKAFDCSIIT